MATCKKIKVLIVDDSVVFRKVLSRAISADPALEVVASAENPFDAKDKILKFEPDVMTCDVEMPKMNGIEFIRRLIPQYPLPVIVVSSVNNVVFDALGAGAVDFVAKPNVSKPGGLDRFVGELIAKIKIAANAKVSARSGVSNADPAANPLKTGEVNTKKIVAIGASTGGTEALFSLLGCLPGQMPGIVVVQHIPPVFSKMFADRLNSQLSLNVKEACDKDEVEPGRVLIAPGDRHMRIIKSGNKYKVSVFAGEKVNGHCPSVDVLFDSAASEAGKNAIGIILTGMGSDGAKGLLSMRRAGARTIGQDERSSVVYGMPKAAYEIGAVEKQHPLQRIPLELCLLLK